MHHVPMSVSVASNVPGRQGPMCFVSKETRSSRWTACWNRWWTQLTKSPDCRDADTRSTSDSWRIYWNNFQQTKKPTIQVSHLQWKRRQYLAATKLSKSWQDLWNIWSDWPFRDSTHPTMIYHSSSRIWHTTSWVNSQMSPFPENARTKIPRKVK